MRARASSPLPAQASPQDEGGQGREFAWTGADFSRVQALIYQRAGISLHDGKHAMVYSRLSRRLRETGHTSFNDYLGWLEGHDGPEWQEFVNALTTNLTAFFREQHHFEILASLLRMRAAGPWSIWCNAASTGEEPYSIVMTVQETLGASVPFKLAASDIDSRVLATASRGVYRLDSLKGLSQERLQRFFLRGKGANEGLVRVKPELAVPRTFRRGVLPQCHDLFRCAHPAARARTHPPRAQAGRHAVRGTCGEFQRLPRPFRPARKDRL
jgi:chemotaxis protein methyltransferase CheR